VDRNTLAWYRCSVCGRKGVVYECILGGSRVSLCPHCAVTLSAECPGLRLPRVRRVRGEREDAEVLVSRVERALRARSTRRARRRG